MTSEELAREAVRRGALQKVTELEWLIEVIRGRNIQSDRPLHRVLEIGSWEGGMLWLWLQLADDVWSIDPRPVPYRDWWNSRLTIVTARSEDATDIVPARFDLVFIDGDHSHKGVYTDWDLYAPRADLVVLHDIAPWDPTPEEVRQGYGDRGVEELWHVVKSQYRTEEFRDQNSYVFADGRTIDHREGGIGVAWMR
jgi:hypothetical protein